MKSRDEYLNITQAAEFLKVHPSTLRNWDKWDILKPFRNPKNNHRFYKKEDLIKFLDDIFCPISRD